MIASTDSKLIKPALPNLPTPPSIKVERAGGIQSPNAAGGEVPRPTYSKP